METPPQDDADFGIGDFPADLDRLNWGALFLPGLWALAHGVWRWLAVFVVFTLVSIPSFIYFNTRLQVSSLPLLLAVYVAAATVGLALAAYFAAHANRLAWEVAAHRQANKPDLPALSVLRYRNAERVWAIVGVALAAFSHVSGPVNLARIQPARLLPTALSSSWYFLLVAALWLYDRRKAAERRSDEPTFRPDKPRP